MNASLFLTCFFVYISAMILFGCWISRRKQSGNDFLLGGRALPLFLTLGTTVATMVGTGSSMGAVGKSYENGWMGSYMDWAALWVFSLRPGSSPPCANTAS
jgi:SSS family solute:Na+ symporter